MTSPATNTLEAPHARDADAVIASLDDDVETGLDPQEVEARLQRFGSNELETAEGPNVWSRLIDQFVDPLVIILMLALLISLAAWWYDGADGIPYEPIVILLILVANAVLGLWQEIKADNAVEELQRMTATHAEVRRGGERVTIPSRDLVPGDILLLSEGDAVSADARVINSE